MNVPDPFINKRINERFKKRSRFWNSQLKETIFYRFTSLECGRYTDFNTEFLSKYRKYVYLNISLLTIESLISSSLRRVNKVPTVSTNFVWTLKDIGIKFLVRA